MSGRRNENGYGRAFAKKFTLWLNDSLQDDLSLISQTRNAFKSDVLRDFIKTEANQIRLGLKH